MMIAPTATDGTSLVYSRDAHDDRTENREDQCQRRDQNEEYAQRKPKIIGTVVTDGWRAFRADQRKNEDIGEIQTDEHEAGQERTQEHVHRHLLRRCRTHRAW